MPAFSSLDRGVYGRTREVQLAGSLTSPDHDRSRHEVVDPMRGRGPASSKRIGCRHIIDRPAAMQAAPHCLGPMRAWPLHPKKSGPSLDNEYVRTVLSASLQSVRLNV